MLNAVDVANFFIYLMPNKENELTNLKMNKLLFYAQGHCLQRFSKPLFADEIQAWQYGPVVPSVYHTFKDYRNQPISTLPKSFDSDKFSEEEKELLVDVARVYGQYTGEALKNLTHKDGSPWSQVYDPYKRDIRITNDSIKEFFNKLPSIELPEFEIAEDDIIGYRDENDVLVLPEEYDY